MLKRLTAAAMLICLLVLLISPAMAFEPGIAATTADWLNFRTQPDMSGRVIDLIPIGSEVEILEDLGNWCRIEWNGMTGYVFSEYLSQAKSLNSSGSGSSRQSDVPQGVVFGIVLGDEVRFRKTASLAGDIYGYFYRDVIVKVLEQGTQWTKVDFNDTVGYIASQYIWVGTPTVDELIAAETATYISVWQPAVTVSAQPPAPVQPEKQPAAQTNSQPVSQPAVSEPEKQPAVQVTEPGVSADDIIATAKSCLGVPYRSGGTSMKGFDCSGFTYYVFGQNGITLNRTATAQYQQGTHISKSELQPGDLVFFTNEDSGPNIGHVGIYIGDGKVIHASSGHWQIVIADMSVSWFVEHYYGAARILK